MKLRCDGYSQQQACLSSVGSFNLHQPTQRVNKRIRVHSPNHPVQTFVESVRAYDQKEVLSGLEQAGLEVEALYGSFEGGKFHRDSERLILVGSKPA